jgi:hypothetical protein
METDQGFDAWWASPESPAKHMTETAAYFCKPFIRQAYNAGLHDRGNRIANKPSKREIFAL